MSSLKKLSGLTTGLTVKEAETEGKMTGMHGESLLSTLFEAIDMLPITPQTHVSPWHLIHDTTIKWSVNKPHIKFQALCLLS